MPSNSEEDPFSSLLTLEDTLYTTAYTLGATAGSNTGRIEGRIFGLEKGFDKFSALGSLHGRSVVWGSRALQVTPTSPNARFTSSLLSTQHQEPTKKDTLLPKLPENGKSRLLNNITLLHSLTDPETFSTLNTEDAVADFDDRVRRAGAKAKVIGRIVGEGDGVATTAKSPEGSPAKGKGRSVRLESESKGKRGDDNIEDFAGSRLLR
jgi:hypothetical protein